MVLPIRGGIKFWRGMIMFIDHLLNQPIPVKVDLSLAHELRSFGAKIVVHVDRTGF